MPNLRNCRPPARPGGATRRGNRSRKTASLQKPRRQAGRKSRTRRSPGGSAPTSPKIRESSALFSAVRVEVEGALGQKAVSVTYRAFTLGGKGPESCPPATGPRRVKSLSPTFSPCADGPVEKRSQAPAYAPSRTMANAWQRVCDLTTHRVGEPGSEPSSATGSTRHQPLAIVGFNLRSVESPGSHLADGR